jgi:transcriptional regulator PpsR
VCYLVDSVNQEGSIAAVVSGVTIAQADVTLILDMNGIIQNVTLSNDVADENVDGWHGRLWPDIVGDSGHNKIQRMVQDALHSGVCAFRQINQVFPSGRELPMEYTTVRLGGTAGLIAVGRNLKVIAELQSRLVAAQQAMEQDYWKLREVETRYRLLFDASNEAVLLLNPDTLRVVESNPAAIRAFGLGRGLELLPEIAAEEREAFQSVMLRVRQYGRAPGTLVHLGPDRQAWTARASLMAGEPGPVVLLQLAPVGMQGPEARRNSDNSLDDFFDRLPDAFVVIDRDGTICRANRAFLDLVRISSEGMVLGERLARWLSRPGADISVLLANLQRHGSVRLFSTWVQTELGEETEVEISAVGHPPGRAVQVALLIRDVGRRLAPNEQSSSLQSALAAIIEQTGRTSLRSLVRDAVGLVERHYIGAALELVDGNRTAASELLGLSRQGFYKKLAQYEMEGHSKGGPDPEK